MSTPLTIKRLQDTVTEHEHSSVEELRERLVASFGPDVDDVIDQLLSMVERDISEGRDPLGVLGGAFSILLLAVSKGGAA